MNFLVTISKSNDKKEVTKPNSKKSHTLVHSTIYPWGIRKAGYSQVRISFLRVSLGVILGPMFEERWELSEPNNKLRVSLV